jgi:hypothetical protein
MLLAGLAYAAKKPQFVAPIRGLSQGACNCCQARLEFRHRIIRFTLKGNAMSNVIKVKSLVAALAIALSLNVALLLKMNDVAVTGAQNARQAARAQATVPALAAFNPIRRIALEPITIVARREKQVPASGLASANNTTAPLPPLCVKVAEESTFVEKDEHSCG